MGDWGGNKWCRGSWRDEVHLPNLFRIEWGRSNKADTPQLDLDCASRILQSPNMQYQIEYASEADAPALGQINTLSFSGQPLLSNLFPGSSQSTLQAYKAKYAFKYFADPTIHVVKVADPTSGDIIGYGRWHISETLTSTSVPELSEEAQAVAQDPLRFAPRPMNESLFATFKSILDAARKRHTTEKDIGESLFCVCPVQG